MDRNNENIYVTIFNVPVDMTKFGTTNSFVEIRAELVAFQKDEPLFLTEINNLPVMEATNIIWSALVPVIEKEIADYYITKFKIKK
jgi:hypothetical protein